MGADTKCLLIVLEELEGKASEIFVLLRVAKQCCHALWKVGIMSAINICRMPLLRILPRYEGGGKMGFWSSHLI